MSNPETNEPLDGIAIIGMAGRFPGAATLEEFWQNLRDGVDSISRFAETELERPAGMPDLRHLPGYVPARGVLEDVAGFDAAFFGFSAREAEITDPQHRLFLECAWEALERAGAIAEQERVVGVFAGTSMSTYLFNVYSQPAIIGALTPFQVMIANDKDHLTTRVSYKLNLRGPSVAVQTACSTSLVSVHLACQSLLSRECDIALAGGAAITVPQRSGYLYQEGGILSPDGRCRPFDDSAQGTVFSNGVGVVALKRLEDALADGDPICAVILGSAINNDGAQKIGYTAPSVDGQAAVIAEAQQLAGVEPETIGYVETHGTGTPLGDPIELAALTQAFGAAEPGSCAIGTVKSNIGHLDSAAGVAGLIKTVLALQHGLIPPSLHCETPNRRFDFARSPFVVSTTARPWPDTGGPRRAGVSSFGMGGTNAHVVLEQAPALAPSGPDRPWQVLPLSAKTPAALRSAAARLREHLAQSEAKLADVAYTLQTARRSFEQRCAVVCRDRDDALAALADPARWLVAEQPVADRPVAFLFPGQGAQYAGMARELYESLPVFRAQLDRCAELLTPHLGLDLRALLFPDEGRTTKDEGAFHVDRTPGADEGRTTNDHQAASITQTTSSGASTFLNAQCSMLNSTEYAQPALFAVSYALAQQWIAWGVRPGALIGHSVGEYVAACLAGVFALEDALALVAARGRLMQELPPGAMLSVALPEAELLPLLGPELALAAVNSPSQCVVSGPQAAVEALARRLAERGAQCRRLHTSHAFHSAMMAPAVEPFRRLVARVRRSAPAIPCVSNRSGGWLGAAEACDPDYWAAHIRDTVRFGDGLRTLAARPEYVLLEVGPGQTLSTFARRHPQRAPEQPVVSSMRHAQDQTGDLAVLRGAQARLWLAGAALDWRAAHAPDRRRRLPLPTYPFERQRYWIDTQAPAEAPQPAGEPAAPAELHGRPALGTLYAAPEGELEQTLCEIWQELLGVAPIGRHDHFFELGGHSLLATQVSTRLRATFDLDVPVRVLVEGPTIAELGAAVEALLIERIELMSEEEALRLV
jgi:acyl transferase domain-containing protein